MRKRRDPGELEARLGYRFADRDLFDRALTHSSAVAPSRRTQSSYQRLEFLGDRVLGLVIADLLYERLPKSDEGDLSRALNALVRREMCALVARELLMGEAIHLGESEARTGGADKEAILADVCEAIIGAIYLDGGLMEARDFVVRMFGPHLEETSPGRSDAKTTLQEWTQARSLETPTYTEVGRTGPDHAPVFVIAVSVPGYEPIEATGPSKKLAEHRAADAFLTTHKVWQVAS